MTKKCGEKFAAEAGFDFSKRRFLTTGAAAAGVALASGVMLYGVGAGAADRADGAKRWGMLIDVNKCEAGCDVCIHACSEENGITGFDRPKSDAQWIELIVFFNVRREIFTDYLFCFCCDIIEVLSFDLM